MIEIYKNIDSLIISSAFLFENIHNIQKFQTLSNNAKKTVKYDFEAVSYGSSFSWANLLQD